MKRESIKKWSDDLVGRTVYRIGGHKGEKAVLLKKSLWSPRLAFDENDNAYNLVDWSLTPSEHAIIQLTLEDLTDDLIGREVVWNSAKHVDVKVGKRYEVVDIDLEQELITIKDDVGDRRDMHVERFALPVEEKQSNLAETTHSCTLAFPNGDIVTIPGPGEGWASEHISEVEDEFEHIDCWVDRVTHASRTSIRIKEQDASEDVECYEIKHERGLCVLHDYLTRINKQKPDVLKLTKHTRTAYLEQFTPVERYADDTDLCISETGDRAATLKGWPERRPSGAVQERRN